MKKEERKQFDGFFPLDGTEYFEPTRPLVEGIIPKDEITMISGAPKVGKSTFAAHLSYSVATGEPFLGHDVSESGEVVYLAMERAYQTQQRIYKLFELGERTPANVILVKPQESDLRTMFFNEPKQVVAFTSKIEDTRLKNPLLLIVDSLMNTLIGSDNNAEDMGPWFDGVSAVAEHFNMAVLVLHHDNKAAEGRGNNPNAYRGHSSILARAGAWIHATNPQKNIVELSSARDNFGFQWSATVGFNDFGLYTESMPEQGKGKKPQFEEFVKARLAERPMVTNKELTEIVKTHPNSEWRHIMPDRVSDAIKSLGSQVIKHANPSDGRSKLLQLA